MVFTPKDDYRIEPKIGSESHLPHSITTCYNPPKVTSIPGRDVIFDTFDIGTLDAATLAEERSQLIHQLGVAAGADFSLFIDLPERDGVITYGEIIAADVSSEHDLITNSQGTPVLNTLLRSVRYPTEGDRTRFLSLNHRARRDGASSWLDHQSLRAFWAARGGIGDELRTLVFKGHRCIGFLGLYRWEGNPFSEAEVHKINTLVGGAHAALTTIQSRMEELRPDELQLLISPTGEITHASPEARPWLTSARRDRLRYIIRQLDAHREDPVWIHVIDAMEIRVTRLLGDGSSIYVVHLVPRVPPRHRPDAALTPAQRRVADYAAAGATAEEIARALDISFHTVKTHLRNIYERLGVANRVELAEALS